MGDDSFDRRKFLAATGVAGAGLLAGCNGPTEEKLARTAAKELDSVADESPPEPPTELPDGEHWQYVVESLDYQNRLLQAQVEALQTQARGDAQQE